MFRRARLSAFRRLPWRETSCVLLRDADGSFGSKPAAKFRDRRGGTCLDSGRGRARNPIGAASRAMECLAALATGAVPAGRATSMAPGAAAGTSPASRAAVERLAGLAGLDPGAARPPWPCRAGPAFSNSPLTPMRDRTGRNTGRKGRASGNSHSRGLCPPMRRASRVLRNRRNPLMRLRPEWCGFAAIPLIRFMDS